MWCHLGGGRVVADRPRAAAGLVLGSVLPRAAALCLPEGRALQGVEMGRGDSLGGRVRLGKIREVCFRWFPGCGVSSGSESWQGQARDRTCSVGKKGTRDIWLGVMCPSCLRKVT